ncbi:hypothetical protein JCM10135_01190 [Stetteria hydrogenophila]
MALTVRGILAGLKRGEIAPVYLVLLYSILVFVLHLTGVGPKYGDEELYIGCGLAYVRGVCPLECNPEHPPFAKYLYGLMTSRFSVAGVHVFLYLLSVASLLIVYYTLSSIYSWREALLGGLLLSTSGLIANVWSYALLDGVEVFFIVASYWLLVTRGVRSRLHLALSGLLAALGFYSKYTAAFYLAGLLLAALLAGRREVRRALLGSAAYSILFIAALFPVMYHSCLAEKGLAGVAGTLYATFSYHGRVHALRPATSLISLLKMFTGVEVWRFYKVNVTVVNGSFYAVSNPIPKGFLVQFTAVEYAPYVTVVLVALAFKLARGGACRGASDPRVVAACIVGSASLAAHLLLGLLDPIAWYYLPLHYFAALMAPVAVESEKGRVLLALLNAAYLAAALALGIPRGSATFEFTV